MTKDLYQECITFAAFLTCSPVTYAGLFLLFKLFLVALFAVLFVAAVKDKS